MHTGCAARSRTTCHDGDKQRSVNNMPSGLELRCWFNKFCVLPPDGCVVRYRSVYVDETCGDALLYWLNVWDLRPDSTSPGRSQSRTPSLPQCLLAVEFSGYCGNMPRAEVCQPTTAGRCTLCTRFWVFCQRIWQGPGAFHVGLPCRRPRCSPQAGCWYHTRLLFAMLTSQRSAT
jgi:hypothetical protein